MAVARRKVEAHEQKLRELKERLDQDIKKKEEEQRRQCEVILWRQYCLLPNGDAPSAVVKATEMKFKNVKMVPVHPAPQSWVDEVMKNVLDMEEAGAEKDYEQPWLADCSDENERILKPWRELAVWLIHHGPYKGRMSELGVLGEVLGFVEKGMFWKKWIVESE